MTKVMNIQVMLLSIQLLLIEKLLELEAEAKEMFIKMLMVITMISRGVEKSKNTGIMKDIVDMEIMVDTKHIPKLQEVLKKILITHTETIFTHSHRC